MKIHAEWFCPNCKEKNIHQVDLGDSHFLDPRKVYCNDEEGGCGKIYFLDLKPTVEVKVLELKEAQPTPREG